MGLRAVVFDVDYTLAQPGPDLGAGGFLSRRRALRARSSTPRATTTARRAAFDTLEQHPELDHDEEIWVLFTQRIIEGMGGEGDTYGPAVELTRAWEHAAHFELYDDVLPTLDAAARPRPEARPALEHGARPQCFCRAPRA